MMRKFVVVAVLVGAAVFPAASLANDGSATTSAKSSKFAMRYLFADMNVSAGDTGKKVFKCPKNWHPVSGLFSSDSDEVVNISSAPTSQRNWAVSVRNEAEAVGKATASVTLGAVCVKGLPITGSG